jgi:dUTP pyrophosphatase
MDPFFTLDGTVAAYAEVVAVRPQPQAFEVELRNGTRIASEPLAAGEVQARMARFVEEWRSRTSVATGTPILEVLKLQPTAVLPVRGSAGASCFDLCAFEAGVLQPGEWRIVKTGLSMAVPVGYEIQVRSRSGLAAKRGIFVLNSPGTVDSDYRGEVGVILANLGKAPFEYAAGDRIAQAAVCPVAMSALVEVKQLSDTQRGAGGFGSTGVTGAIARPAAG